MVNEMEEGRKRLLGIMASILVARRLKTTEDLHDSRPSPRIEALVGSAAQWAERIMRRIDGTFANSADENDGPNLEETVISVWRQAMVEDAKILTLAKSLRYGGQADLDRGKSILISKATNCGGSNKILKRARGGRNWRDKERRSCSFSAVDVTSRLWWTKRCSFMERPGGRNWNGRC